LVNVWSGKLRSTPKQHENKPLGSLPSRPLWVPCDLPQMLIRRAFLYVVQDIEGLSTKIGTILRIQ